jgi:hypothetical protein
MIYGWCIFLAYYSVAGLLFASARKWGIDGFRKITLWESCNCPHDNNCTCSSLYNRGQISMKRTISMCNDRSISRDFLGPIFMRPITAIVAFYDRGHAYSLYFPKKIMTPMSWLISSPCHRPPKANHSAINVRHFLNHLRQIMKRCSPWSTKQRLVHRTTSHGHQGAKPLQVHMRNKP